MAETLRLRLDHGFGCRIRTLFSYRKMAIEKGAEVLCYWPVDDHCPGRFSDFFEPVEGVEFTDRKPKNFYHSRHCLPQYDGESMFLYDLLRPRPALQVTVLGLVEKRYPYAGIHVRRTDREPGAAKYGRNTTDEDIIEYLDELPKDWSLFLSTDNAESQGFFKDLYGTRLFFYQPICEGKGRRHTTLFHSLVDAYAAIAADRFVGMNFSGFSDFIRQHHRFLDKEKRLDILRGSYHVCA